jgi:hypothetical protein
MEASRTLHMDAGMLNSYMDSHNDSRLLDVETLDKCLHEMKKGKAAGMDGIEVEHLIFAHPLIEIQLCVLFNIMLMHGIVPKSFGMGVVVPLVKNRDGDVTDLDNYRGITISTCFSKLFEMCLLKLYDGNFGTSDLQFGFKKKFGCKHAIYMLRTVIDYYNKRDSTVNIAFLDMSKAFDKVSFDVLFGKLMKRNVPGPLVRVLVNWYASNMSVVKWGSYLSNPFLMQCGVRQGGVLSPVLFTIYVNDMIERLKAAGEGCWVGDAFVGCAMYADDLVLLAPSILALQLMVNTCSDEAVKLDMLFNVKKSVVLRVGPRFKAHCNPITVSGNPLEFVDRAKYLGIQIESSSKFKIDLHLYTSKLFRSFNSLYRKCSKANPETVVMQLVTSHCKPFLLYVVECFNLNKRDINRLCYAWNSVIARIFNVRGNDVEFVSKIVDVLPLQLEIISRKIKFLRSIHVLNSYVLNMLYDVLGEKELTCAGELYDINFNSNVNVKTQLVEWYHSQPSM